MDIVGIKQKSISGLVILISRSFFLQLVALGGIGFLSIFLDVAEIGIFYGVSEIVAVLGYFSDVGLAAALIQKHNKVSTTDLRTTFTIQQILVSLLCAGIFLFTPWLRSYYDLSQTAIYLMWAFTTAFFLASLKTIPSVILERNLQFKKLVLVEAIEVLLFYGIAVYCAWQGWGLWSYIYAVLARGIIGTAVLYIISPWNIGFAFSKKSFKELTSFGLPYQANTLLALIKDRFLNLLLFSIIGNYGMGIIGWVQNWSQKPLRFLSDNVNKVTFPAFSRLQNHPEELTRSIEKMIFYSGIIIFPVLIGMGVVIQPALALVPCYQDATSTIPCDVKWGPALFAFYLYLYNTAWASISTPITNTLAAIGKIKIVSKLLIMWTILSWLIIVPLAYLYDYNGVAIGMAIVGTTSIVPIIILKRTIEFSFITSVSPSLISSSIMGVITWISIYFWPWNNYAHWEYIRLLTSITLGVITYIAGLYLFSGKRLQTEFVKIYKIWKSK